MADSSPAAPTFDAEAYVEQASLLLGLDLDPAFRPGVVTNIALIRRMGDLVMSLPLAVADEPAPVFHPAETGP
jgi:hypothetical protein